MGKTAPHRLSETVTVLGRALHPNERRAVASSLRGLVAWQRSLSTFPRVHGAPDSTPYVSLYARGALRGCYGSDEGSANERLARAFVLASTDSRYGSIKPEERATLAADATFLARATPVRVDEALARLEPGLHGVAIVRGEHASVLLPSVARERGHDAASVLELAWKKARAEPSREGIVWLVDVEEVSSHGVFANDALSAAKHWLESIVSRDGSIAYAMDGASGELRANGVMRHGRAAVAIEALAKLGSSKTRAVRRWLAHEIDRALRGEHVEDWPDRDDVTLGTLALATRAGLSFRDELARRASQSNVKKCSPWHAAQVASVLGMATPRALWDHVVTSLDARPSPYALLAARARGDRDVTERASRAIVDAIRHEPPFTGGASLTPVPETALTAAMIEALGARGPKRVLHRAREFVRARQIVDVPASLDPRTLGAFRASPIAPIFRCDITAHAVLALHK